MNILLEKLKNSEADNCLTIALNTHHTFPDNKKDPIALKNLITTAEERLISRFDKKLSGEIMNRLNLLSESLDHSQNDRSLILFVNEDIAEFIRLPISVLPRVVIGKSFAKRDLIRAIQEDMTYYILIISKNGARLLMAHNDKPIQEMKGDFPFKNDTFYNSDSLERSMGQSNDNLIEEFFNIIDKAVQKTHKTNPLPIVIVADGRNYQHYIKVADIKDIYIAHVNKEDSYETDEPHHVVENIWDDVLNFKKEINASRIEELKIAVSGGQFLSDLNEINKAIKEGRGQTLFVHKDYFQTGRNVDDSFEFVNEDHLNENDAIDDLIEILIENVKDFGGDVVFIENEDLQDFQNLALVTRY